MNTPSTAGHPVIADQYDVSILVPAGTNQAPLFMANLPVICAELLSSQGFHALIGRDILTQCVFLYNGGNGGIGFFTLAY